MKTELKRRKQERVKGTKWAIERRKAREAKKKTKRRRHRKKKESEKKKRKEPERLRVQGTNKELKKRELGDTTTKKAIKIYW